MRGWISCMAAKSSPACQGVGKAALDLFCAGSFWATHSKTNERPKKKYEIQDSDLSKQNVNLGPARACPLAIEQGELRARSECPGMHYAGHGQEARIRLCFRSQQAGGVPCLGFVWPAPYLHGVCADHAQSPLPVPNPGLARLAGPPVSRYPRWQRRSGVVLDLPF